MPNSQFSPNLQSKRAGFQTAVHKRMLQVRKQFGCENIALGYLDGRPCVGKLSRDIRKQVSDSVKTTWEEGMKQRSTLARYRNFKKIRGSREVQYDNSRGSAPLALARAGALQTGSTRARYVHGEEGTCHNCGVYEETIEHIIHECGDRYAIDIETYEAFPMHRDSQS